MWRETTVCVLVILLLFSLLWLRGHPRVKVEEMFCPCGVDVREMFHNNAQDPSMGHGVIDSRGKCPCGCNCSGICTCQRCPYSQKFPLPTLHKWACGAPGSEVRGEPADDASCPYYRRSWPVCTPCGAGSDLDCQTQSYVAPETPGGPQKYQCGKFEGYSNFPRDSVSCSPSCETSDPLCAQNPYGQNYQDPRWLNARFWNQQEQFPGLPGGRWYPTPNMQ